MEVEVAGQRVKLTVPPTGIAGAVASSVRALREHNDAICGAFAP